MAMPRLLLACLLAMATARISVSALETVPRGRDLLGRPHRFPHHRPPRPRPLSDSNQVVHAKWHSKDGAGHKGSRHGIAVWQRCGYDADNKKQLGCCKAGLICAKQKHNNGRYSQCQPKNECQSNKFFCDKDNCKKSGSDLGRRDARHRMDRFAGGWENSDQQAVHSKAQGYRLDRNMEDLNHERDQAHRFHDRSRFLDNSADEHDNDDDETTKDWFRSQFHDDGDDDDEDEDKIKDSFRSQFHDDGDDDDDDEEDKTKDSLRSQFHDDDDDDDDEEDTTRDRYASWDAPAPSSDAVPIGCFKNDPSLGLVAVEKSGSCSASAAAKHYPLSGEMDGKCYGTTVIPPPTLLQAGATCGAGSIALNYWMEDKAAEYKCAAVALPITDAHFKMEHSVTVANGVATMVIEGDKTVGKMTSVLKTYGYGLYSAKISMPPDDGGVGCMYTTTDDSPDHKEWDEVDYELLNTCGDKGCKPVAGWANTFKLGNNKWGGKEWGKVMWTDPSVASKPTVYTMSWHPNNIFWYRANQYIYKETSKDHELPYRAGNLIFSFWRPAKDFCQWFGGCSTNKKLTLTVEDIRVVHCTKK